MNNLEQLSERLDSLQSELVRLRVDLSDAIISAKEEQDKPVGKYEISDVVKETIIDLLDRFIDKNVFSELDTSHQQNVYGGGIDIDITFDLQDIVSDQLGSSRRMADDFLEELIRELENLKDEEEDEATESGDEQHQDC
jgi:gas vesicle protein